MVITSYWLKHAKENWNGTRKEELELKCFVAEIAMKEGEGPIPRRRVHFQVTGQFE